MPDEIIRAFKNQEVHYFHIRILAVMLKFFLKSPQIA
ncbi:hypothetical protein EHW99_3012 [Erwinia amylovora]|uniref:Uncharacterized protein n=2 Tax=Erwinia amylovora TaxID=552 RepID=A0A831EPX6_ERWAM|nr:hypothetical protein EaACW_0572 [Erwinia amylovora ACW56400]QJQ55711.1 hypothetical protein EHX00_3012 [Erwinia amylovora]CBA19516.1 hypothetical protein predicted by Glimmer/Critica [Erwinia amylovora CFBP1430]CCO77418.1 hypothetical protein BN432_0586 [Erwinia amylovora Ea356]CCO81203.1 hypothetical protein BN433_0597 [Erwinia amylovora Ea266]CCO85008.1 hypothetical protein BN434_0586 [Erwinia amylovora CFBP 2585]CCO88792.1 hypothetical protein BN435_0585 [Erwinia amylovora 01SFR-BO]CCO